MGNGSSRTRVESAGDLTTIDDNNNSNANTISHDHNNQTAIELQLIEQQLNDLFRFKILLLGAGESGKSTVVKQLQLIHSKKKMQDKELSLIAQSLHSNVIDCMKALVHAATTFNYAPQFNDNDRNIINALFSHDENERITLDLCNALITLFNTQPIQLTYERRSEFWLLDSFPYCMQHLQRFCQTSFVPTEEDTVMARIRTTGIVVTELQHRIVAERPDEPNYLTYQVVDVGGQRNERKKWLHCFDNVTAIMFIVNLAGYNQVLFEDQRKNRMVEELELFSTITHNPLFADTPIMLFLNKKDLFETMIQQASLKKAFPHYNGGSDLQSALHFIEQEFLSRLPAGKSVSIQVVTARWKRDIRAAFDDVKSMLYDSNKESLLSAAAKLRAKKQQLLKQSTSSNNNKSWFVCG